MKAFILAAGVGSRLKPWTDHHPKALVDIAGKPMIQRVIENVASSGVDGVVVNVHHFSEQIVEFLENHDFGVNIMISDESSLLLDTGGGLRKAVDYFEGEDVLVHNADILTDYDLSKLIAVHKRCGNDATLLMGERPSSRKLVFDKNMRLKGWTNTTTGEVKPGDLITAPDDRYLSFQGIHILSSGLYNRLIDYRPDNTPFSIIDFYIAHASTHNITGVIIDRDARWFDVGKPATLEEAIRYMTDK